MTDTSFSKRAYSLGGEQFMSATDELQPVLSLLTHGLHVHGTRIEELAGHLSRPEQQNEQQASAVAALTVEKCELISVKFGQTSCPFRGA